MDFEPTVIGSMMLDNFCIPSVRAILSHTDFQNSNYSEVYRCLLDMSDKNTPCDALSVADELLRDKYTASIGLNELVDLVDSTPSAANVEHYAKQVKDNALLRNVARIGHLANECDSGEEAIEMALKQLTQMDSTNNKTNWHINDALNDVIADVEGIFNNTVEFMSTGLDQIDGFIHGFQAGGLYIIAARPAMGKSVLALNIAAKMAKEGVPTKVFSLEMPKKEVAYRMVCAASNMNTRAKYNMQDEDWAKLTAGFTLLKDQPIEVDDGSGYTVGYLKNAIRTHHQKNGRGLYVVDYLQLIKVNGDNRVQGIGEITRELKSLAKEIESPIVLLSQLNRAVDQRPDKRPNMSDLRESGELEQDADVIIMLYRDEVYNENSEAKGIAEALIRKNRQGEIGTAYMASRLQFSRFDNLQGQS